MKSKATCKYYDEEYNKCRIDYEDCMISQCNVYENKYVKVDCEHIRSSAKKAYCYECKVLSNDTHGHGAPCCNPKKDKKGNPVQCTFYKKKEAK